MRRSNGYYHTYCQIKGRGSQGGVMTALNTTTRGEQIDAGRLLWVGPLTVVVAVAVNLLVRALLLAVLPISPEFPPFGIGSVIAFTAVGVALAVAVFAVLSRVSRRPVRTFRIVAIVALLLSIIPNVVGVVNPTALPLPFTGATSTAFAGLIAFHVVAALISIAMLTTLARR